MSPLPSPQGLVLTPPRTTGRWRWGHWLGQGHVTQRGQSVHLPWTFVIGIETALFSLGGYLERDDVKSQNLAYIWSIEE